MGYSKKLYNVLGGVTSIIISLVTLFDYPQNTQISQNHNFVFVNYSQNIPPLSSHIPGIFRKFLGFLLGYVLF